MKKNILVLCTGNSCRSQIAEGFLRKYLGDMANIYSAGIETHGVNPKAVKTMAKIGIDISSQTSNHIDEYQEIPMDFLLSVCDHAKESCPIFKTLGVHLHYNFLDPSKTIGTTEEIEESFDDVRDLIDEYCREFARTHFGNLI